MRFATAIFVFIATTVTSAILLAFPMGGVSPSVAGISFLLGGFGAAFAWRGVKHPSSSPLTAWDILMLTILALVSLRTFLWLIYSVGDEWKVLSPNNLGDISFHLHLIRYLAGGADFWPISPILAGTPLTYPVGADLFNALLTATGVPVEKGLIWTGLAGAGLAGWALWRWGGAFALAAFLFNGGLAGILILRDGHVADFQADLAWKNLFLTMFVTQRGLLYALPCGLFLLSTWREDLFGNGSGVPRWIALLLYATMPIFNAHAFVFLSLTLACAFLVTPPKRKFLVTFVACAFLPATLALYFVTGHFSAGSGMRWLPGWMQGNEAWLSYLKNLGPEWLQSSSPVVFWIWNFGISLPLLGLLAWKLIRKRDASAICFAGTGLFVFVLCCLVSFAPWEWDNTKLFLWAWLACAPFLWEMISKWRVPVRVLVCFVLFFSGALSLVGGIDGRHGYKVASRMELAETATRIAAIPLEDCIAVDPDYNHPVMLLGRPVYCGYEGHLWSHGLDYRTKWEILQKIMKHQGDWKEAMSQIDAKWLYMKTSPPLVLKIVHPAKE